MADVADSCLPSREISNGLRAASKSGVTMPKSCAGVAEIPVIHFIGASVIAAAEVGTLALALFALAVALAVARFAGLAVLSSPEKPRSSLRLMRRWACSPSRMNSAAAAPRIRLVLAQAERLGLLHQPLYGAQLPHHGGGIDGLIELERAAEIEPFDHLRKIDALEVLVVDLADGGADQFAGHGIAAFELALVFQFELAGDGGSAE